MTEPIIHARTCHLCEANCGVLMTVKDGQVTSVKGNPDHVLSEGYICPKATAIPDLQNDPDRLRWPIKKVGETWEEISWEQAFSEIAERHAAVMDSHKSAAMYMGNPNAHNYAGAFYSRSLMKAWGAKGLFSASTLDQIPHMIAQKWIYGHNALYPVPDIDRTQFMVIVGGNPLASNGSLWTVPNVKKRIKRLQERGGKLVVIDPRRTETAKVADAHHFVKPGTDTAFFLGVLLALDEAELVKPGLLLPMLKDWDAAWGHLRGFDLHALAAYCGMDADVIRGIAKELGNGQPAIMYGRMGVSVVRFGTLNHYLIQLINLATGNVDRAGGVMFPDSVVDPVERSGTGSYGRFHMRLSGRPEVLGELPTAELASEIITEGEGQIGALMTVAGNPVLSAPGGRQLDTALEALDLHVSLDMYVTETSRHADYILPPCGPLERDHYPMFFTPLAIRNYATYSSALFPKPEGSKEDWEIMHGLHTAIKERAGEEGPAKVEPRVILSEIMKTSPHNVTFEDIENAPNGIDLGPLQPRLPERLKTEDKMVHCAPDTCTDDLMAFQVVLNESAGQASSGTYSLIGRRHLRSNNSWLHNSHRLIKGPNRCTMMIHSADAEGLGLADGDRVKVSNDVGVVELPAEITDDIMPGVISIPHGFGHGRKGVKLSVAQTAPGVSMNDLTDPGIVDKLSGNAVLNGVPVTVERV
ncbi:MAG: molybdopterin oxidoreductase family protein [Alphaproteobacteria bacterium]